MAISSSSIVSSAVSLRSNLCFLDKQLVAWAAIFAAVVAALFYPTVANCFKFLSAGSAEIGFFRYAVTAAVWTLHGILPS